MTPDTYVHFIFWLSLSGAVFAGYLSAVRLLTKQCALDRPCPYFLGFPACWVGFVVFLFMLGTIALMHTGYLTAMAAPVMAGFSLLGIIFSGYFTLKEVFVWMRSTEPSKKLVLPSCAYGLVFFIVIFILSVYQ